MHATSMRCCCQANNFNNSNRRQYNRIKTMLTRLHACMTRRDLPLPLQVAVNNAQNTW
jgi:hypothetical protein